jgi:hypothetical protein
MSAHVGSPYVTATPVSGLFHLPDASIFGVTPGTFVIDPLNVSGPTSLVLTNLNTGIIGVPSNYYIVGWGAGGAGGTSVAGNPAGDLIGGGGGAGLAYIISLTFSAPLALSCSITFTVAGSNSTVTFTDTNAVRIPSGTGTATKTISTFSGTGGTSATYSVGFHAAGTGGAGGGQLPGQTPVNIAGAGASAAFIETPPAGFSAWNFDSTVLQISVSSYVGNNGASGLQGAIDTIPVTFTLPVNNAQTSIPRTLTASAAPPGLAAGAGGAGCGSLSVLVPSSGGSGLMYINSSMSPFPPFVPQFVSN